MEKIKIVRRQRLNVQPEFKLPFYIRSTGVNESNFGWSEFFPGVLKPFVQIFWTQSGCGECTIHGKTFLVHAGDFFFHLPGEDHNHRTVGKNWKYYWFAMDGMGAANFIQSYGYGQNVRYAGECPVRLFLELELLLKTHTPYSQRRAIALIAEILALAAGPLDFSPKEDVVIGFTEFVQEHLADERLSVNFVAQKLGVHPTTLHRLVVQKLEISPGEYIRNLRLEHILTKLRDSDIPLKSIAMECGIKYTSYLCRIIQKHTGMTPQDYRHSFSGEAIPKTMGITSGK